MSDSLTIEIDGRSLEASKGEMLIEVADRNGIRIPRFCYHKKLSVAANCRMCLVEVERAPKPLPACATPVMDGMKVMTRSALARGAQKSVMEFLLINHPLDCPICDQGGECELQDVAMGYGRDVSRFVERKRVVKDKNLGPLISTDMTRCIHCTRCVRFGEEIAGLPELGATGRGEHMEIGTYIEKSVDSELSGNVIDLCPVGALTNKPFRFQARAWEMQQREAVSPHDGVGANLSLHIARNRVMRAVPRENEAVNEVWLADRDRFSNAGMYGEDRLNRPLVREGEGFRECDWSEALDHAATAIRTLIESDGAQALGALASPSASLEELSLLQQMMRSLGSGNVDHRLRQSDFSDQDAFPVAPGLGMALEDVESLQAVVLVGANPRKEQPLLNHRLRKAVIAGGTVMSVDSVRSDLNYPVAQTRLVSPSAFEKVLEALEKGGGEMGDLADTLRNADRAAILLGAGVMNHPDAARLRARAAKAAATLGATLCMLHDGGNATGAWLAGAVPHRGPMGDEPTVAGANAAEMIQQPLSGYVLLGVEPERDCADSGMALEAMRQAQCVVALSAFDSPRLREYAHVILPVGLFAETAGTWVNACGLWQSAPGAVPPAGEARPAWKVLRVLGNLLGLDGFDQEEAFQVRDALGVRAGEVDPFAAGSFAAPRGAARDSGGMLRVGTVPIYAVDALVRRSLPLQATADASFEGVRVSPQTASDAGLTDGDEALVRQNGYSGRFTVRVSDAVAEGCVVLPAGIAESEGMGPSHGPVEIGQS